MSLFNCSFQTAETLDIFWQTLYLLMIGAGVGGRIKKSDVDKLPRFRTDFTVIHKEYEYKPEEKKDQTNYNISSDKITITVGDDKMGWAQSLKTFMEILTKSEYSAIKTIELVYDWIRPIGSKLHTFGGTASGHTSLEDMFRKIEIYIKQSEGILEPIHVLDIMNLIGVNVIAGGTRR